MPTKLLAMYLVSQTDPMIGLIAVLAVLIIAIGWILKKIRQPYIVGYILIGVLLGEHGIGVISDSETIYNLGEIGIILLLFFIGMEISLPEFLKQWKRAVFGTILQIVFSVTVAAVIGYFFNWALPRSIVIGFVIALSSSAIVIKLLEDKNLLNTDIGKSVLSILLTQDIMIVPLLIITSQLGGQSESVSTIILMILGGLAIAITLMYIYTKRSITIPFSKRIEDDHEIQVFFAILMCFGGALITSLFSLSAALGAFVGGMIMNAAKATHWIHDTLNSFRVLFVSFFFISVGLQIDLYFISEHIVVVSICLLVVYVTNHLLNSIILRISSCSWKEALLGGALLAQIGELSFLISYTAFTLGIIGQFGYQFSISLICLTLVISPFWIALTQKLLRYKKLDFTQK